MKSTELRIGNWVMGNEPYQIDLSRLITFEYCEKRNEPYAYPIPLTEEWLLKFGFENTGLKMSGSIWFEKGNIRISTKSFGLTVYGISPPTWVIARPEHVHQLQNLYFALCGEELKINL